VLAVSNSCQQHLPDLRCCRRWRTGVRRENLPAASREFPLSLLAHLVGQHNRQVLR
jgi:hypothetical protein